MVGMTVLVSLTLAAWMILVRPQPAQAPADTSWLDVPEATMDAADPVIRETVFRAIGTETLMGGTKELDAMAWTCGRNPDQPPERYLAIIGNSPFRQDHVTWRVEMIPHGKRMDVRVRTAEIQGPPLPDGQPAPGNVQPTRFHQLAISEVADIRDAWSRPELWTQVKTVEHCFDDRFALLQACIHGRYAVSPLRCNVANPSVERLWQRLQAHFAVH
jgi:hypothetical protein